jgi:hypothetical protein
MTKAEIVHDLLLYNMITPEAAVVLLTPETKPIINEPIVKWVTTTT